MSYQLLIFDWDGTLMDSAQKISNCLQASAVDLGLEPPSDQACKNIIGLGLSEAMVILFPNANAELVQNMVVRYRHHWLVEDKTPQALFDGVLEGLNELDQSGALLSIATGKSRAGLKSAFLTLDIEHLFVTSRCADETRSKPNPQMLEEILSVTAIEPGKAIMIGDTSYDMEMAQHAGIDALGVSYGVHTRDTLYGSGALKVVDSFVEMKNWLMSGRLEPAYGG